MVTIIIVLGAILKKNNIISEILEKRLDKVLEIIDNLDEYIIIVSGGTTNNSTLSEAEAMEEYLINHGVLPKYIMKESYSLNTFQNVVMCASLLRSHKFHDENLVVITSDFHMKRTQYIFSHIMSECEIRYISSNNPCNEEELHRLYQKESISLANIQQYFFNIKNSK